MSNPQSACIIYNIKYVVRLNPWVLQLLMVHLQPLLCCSLIWFTSLVEVFTKSLIGRGEDACFTKLSNCSLVGKAISKRKAFRIWSKALYSLSLTLRFSSPCLFLLQVNFGPLHPKKVAVINSLLEFLNYGLAYRQIPSFVWVGALIIKISRYKPWDLYHIVDLLKLLSKNLFTSRVRFCLHIWL